jgi:hypothetical protein
MLGNGLVMATNMLATIEEIVGNDVFYAVYAEATQLEPPSQ